ncbi:hypothetical protein C8Q77DRAFT_1161871 [Trametes polyzona]|nr:hypothetical protein C8Q77DRAFT_1161871 [Trametes polyzona]
MAPKSTRQKGKSKALPGPASDDLAQDESSEADAEELIRQATRKRKPSRKQAANDKEEDLTRQLVETATKYRKLHALVKRVAKTHAGEAGFERARSDASMTGDELSPESEEEDSTVVAQRQRETAFRGRGLFNAPLPITKRLRREGEASSPAASPRYPTAPPLTMTSSGSTVLDTPSTPRFASCVPVSQSGLGSSSIGPGMGSIELHSLRSPLDTTPARADITVHDSSTTDNSLRTQELSMTLASSTPLLGGVSIQTPTSPIHAELPFGTVNAAFRGNQTPSGKPKAGDYEQHVARLINRACHQFEVLLATEEPFPKSGTPVVWAARVWTDVCRSAAMTYRLTDRIEKIITSRSSHGRGAIRDCICPLIASTYDFKDDGSHKSKEHNIARYTYLLNRDAENPDPRFHYKDMRARTGFARNKFIERVIKEIWFSDRTAPGIQFSTQFAPLREATLALVFTTIEYCLDQWSTGLIDKAHTFSDKQYRPKYEQYLCYIQDWSSLDQDATRAVRQRLSDRARRASGAPPETRAPTGLSAASRDRLRADLAAHALDSEGEEDGEGHLPVVVSG